MSNKYSKVTVRKNRKLLYAVLEKGLRAFLRIKGVFPSFTNKCEALPKGPAIVLCTHGSFIDFVYAGIFLGKCLPHFVIARLYFYHKWLSRLLKILGGIPKSMFVLDTESTKNCLRVLRSNGVLVMMPEARLSTVGEYEDIQPTTFSFLKKMGVPVYSFKLCGNYFAQPKWGNGIRRGAPVECELELLFSPEQLKKLSINEIKNKTEQGLYYNEFNWLKNRPEIKYLSPTLAQGLEYVLTVCPLCKQKHTISTKERSVYCSNCGKIATLNSRYAFENFIFKNFKEWYEWQVSLIQNEINTNPNYEMVSEVELRLPSINGKSFTRYAGKGVCTLTRSGLSYIGTKDNEHYEAFYPLKKIYRLLYSANGFFQLYEGTNVQYFVPKHPQSSVDWYVASMLLYDEAYKN